MCISFEAKRARFVVSCLPQVQKFQFRKTSKRLLEGDKSELMIIRTITKRFWHVNGDASDPVSALPQIRDVVPEK
jgi:hypothetical protein